MVFYNLINLLFKLWFMKSKKIKILNKKQDKSKQKEMHPNVAKLKGVLKLPKNFDYKNAIGEYLLEKYNKLK